MEVSMRNRAVTISGILMVALVAPGWAQSTGSVEGFIGFGDNYPPPKKLTVSRDHGVCGASKIDEEFLIDSESHGLANAVIFWQSSSVINTGAGQEPVVIAQSACRYEPHVQVAPSGTEILRVLNNDGILHNVHVFDDEGKTFFNFAQPGFKKQIDKPLPDSKIINIKCDVHDWMNAYIIVLKNAIYTVTDENGRYKLEGLAPGPQKIRIWHEGLGSSSKEVVVEAGQVASLDFVIGK